MRGLFASRESDNGGGTVELPLRVASFPASEKLSIVGDPEASVDV